MSTCVISLNNLKTRVIDSIKGSRNKFRYLYTLFLFTILQPQTVLAAGSAIDSEIDSKLGSIIGALCSVFRAVGIIMTVAGVVMMVLAFKDEDGSAKTRAGMMLGIGVVLIFSKTLLSNMGLGITIN